MVASPALLGGQYTAEQNEDGTWNVLGVPVFAELPPGERRNRKFIGEEWHRRALAHHQQKEKTKEDGGDLYLPPIHVGHHDEGKDTPQAGKLQLSTVTRTSLDGKKQSSLRANFLRVPQVVFDQIERGDLSYLSVEVADWDEPMIASLALLPDEAPFFKWPLLTIGEKRVALSELSSAQFFDGPMRGVFGSPKGGRILFRLFEKGSSMPKKTEKLRGDIPGEEEEGDVTNIQVDQDEDPEPTMRDLLGAMNKGFATLAQAMSGGGGAQFTDDEDEEEKPDENFVEDDGAPAEQKEGATVVAFKGAKNLESAKNLAKLSGEVSALRQESSNRMKADATNALCAKSEKKLEAYGITDATRATIRKFAESGNEELVDEYVTSFMQTVPVDPPTTLARYEATRVSGGRLSEHVEKFRAQGPDAFEAACEADAAYEALAKSGLRVPRDRFVAIGVEERLEKAKAFAEKPLAV